MTSSGVNLFEGRASIVDAHTVRVALAGGGERLLSTERVLIATGGHAVKAPIQGSVSRERGGGNDDDDV